MSSINTSEPWFYTSKPTSATGPNITYESLLAEIRSDLEIAKVRIGGKWQDESRMTRLYALEDTPMRYSGRTAVPKIPSSDSLMLELLHRVNSPEFIAELESLGVPEDVIPPFNAAFVNWYRPPGECDPKKLDSLGYHADDVSDLTSDVILSITLCPPGGERLFRFRPIKNPDGTNCTSGFTWEAEIPDRAVLVMLPGCQKQYKHSVVKRSTHLDRSQITEGRINITFRCIRPDFLH